MNNTTYHIQQWINEADAIVVGAGSGLSSACGYSHYNTVPFFTDNMQPFIEKYGFRSLFQGLTYLYSSPEEEWAYMAHYVKLIQRLASAAEGQTIFHPDHQCRYATGQGVPY